MTALFIYSKEAIKKKTAPTISKNKHPFQFLFICFLSWSVDIIHSNVAMTTKIKPIIKRISITTDNKLKIWKELLYYSLHLYIFKSSN